MTAQDTSAETTLGARGLSRYEHSIMGTYGVPMRVLSHGEGSYVWDVDGKRYLDLLSGIAVNLLGHADPEWVAAIATQAAKLSHTSNFFATEPQIQLAEKLLQISGAPEGSRIFFANSGTEANEAAFKMSRRTGRTRILALEKAFHGRSTGALALTYNAAYREPFEPLAPGVEWIPANDVAALEAAMGEDVAAVFVEPIQGEAGVIPLTHEYLAAVRELTTKHGALMIADEVQTGIARTGTWLAMQAHGIQPDVVTLAKGLGAGFPIGAVIGFGSEAGSLLGKSQHGTTFGGNPLASAAALATLNAVEQRDLLAHAKSLGEHLKQVIGAIPGVVEVRGEGLLLGIKLEAEVSAAVAAAAVEDGFIINPPSPDTIRLAPALVLTQPEADTFVEWLQTNLGAHLPSGKESES
ncbi:acetylornithine transaminase [Demequina zhanjiangensis]|uniref:Acetylornithine aminotransferase n=1 Tax=Demequina zhanjiangensis TaxID=3051659 RepID=A0ABT8G3R5_9MICO|nr:acetylornithine transaminase [Demequina sp. SYSU T00b26]MDN4473771.1 acetylornithine transaminase [Demequina sp. SYSU T00b26]